MRVCTKCEIAKDETEFFYQSRHKNQLHSQCKLCYKNHRKTYHKIHYDKYRSEYLERAKRRNNARRQEFWHFMLSYMADKCCAICGENDIRVLEFDHLDPHEKKFNISQSVKLNYGIEDILQELKKCRILCANCHKKHTAQQMGWYKAL